MRTKEYAHTESQKHIIKENKQVIKINFYILHIIWPLFSEVNNVSRPK